MVAITSDIVLEEVNKFHIRLSNGLEFWAPYEINRVTVQDNNAPRGLGKASPDEIRQAAERIIELFPESTAEDVRRKLIDGSLPATDPNPNYKAIDCSGFIFYVMNGVFQRVYQKDLTHILSVKKEHILNGATFDEWKAVHVLTDEEAQQLPEFVPLRWVVETFHRKPVNMCNITGLMSDYSSEPIVQIADSQPGDLVRMSRDDDPTPHAAIVVQKTDTTISLAHSGRKDPSVPGGVLIEEVPYDQETIHTETMEVPRKFVGIKRLKVPE